VEVPSAEGVVEAGEELAAEVEEVPPAPRLIDTYILLPGPEHPHSRVAMLAALPFLRRSRAVAGFRVEEAMYATRVLIVGDEATYGPEVEDILRRMGCEVDRLGGDPATWWDMFQASARALTEGAEG